MTVRTAPITIGIILLLVSFSHQLIVFHWSLSDSKSPQVSRTLFSILADFNNAAVGTVSTCPVISKSSSPCIKSLVTVPRTPITIGIIVTFLFHSFFKSLARSRYLSHFSLSFNSILWSVGKAKTTIMQILSLLLIIIRSSRLTGIRWSVCILQSQRSLLVSFSRTDSGLWIYHLFVWSKFNFFTIPCGLPRPSSRNKSYTLSVLIYCIRL